MDHIMETYTDWNTVFSEEPERRRKRERLDRHTYRFSSDISSLEVWQQAAQQRISMHLAWFSVYEAAGMSEDLATET
jgi:hypothetical protein